MPLNSMKIGYICKINSLFTDMPFFFMILAFMKTLKSENNWGIRIIYRIFVEKIITDSCVYHNLQQSVNRLTGIDFMIDSCR